VSYFSTFGFFCQGTKADLMQNRDSLPSFFYFVKGSNLKSNITLPYQHFSVKSKTIIFQENGSTTFLFCQGKFN